MSATEAKPNIITIRNRAGNVMREVEADTLRLALEKEARAKRDLRHAYLTGADLRDADLTGADLTGADLTEAKINWQSHALVSELLKRGADGDVEKRKIAGLVAISTDWCWDKFEANCADDPLWNWALDELARWVQDGDDAPAVLRERIVKSEATR